MGRGKTGRGRAGQANGALYRDGLHGVGANNMARGETTAA
jgi:hypothetical protein